MATTTSTTIELERIPSRRILVHPSNESANLSTIDDVAEASRAVDAGVPEGGYGWIAIAACSRSSPRSDHRKPPCWVSRSSVPAIGYLMGSSIAGYLLAAYGGAEAGFKAYRPAIYYAGSMALGAAGLVALVRFRMARSWKEKV